ncbi:unnamed protein product, partial [Ascophyllum nodosum]
TRLHIVQATKDTSHHHLRRSPGRKNPCTNSRLYCCSSIVPLQPVG